MVGSTTKDAAATTRHHVANGELQFQPRHRQVFKDFLFYIGIHCRIKLILFDIAIADVYFFTI